MGFFSHNRTQLGNYDPCEIVANENYYGETGMYSIMIEAQQNDLAIFNAAIMSDFQEAALLQEGATEELYSLQEASVGGFIETLKEYVKKAWEKIKGLFKTFIVKIETMVGTDNKKFAEKYKKEVFGKDLDKMKFKFRKLKKNFLEDGAWTKNAGEKIAESVSSVRKLAPSGGDFESKYKNLSDEVNDSDYMDKVLKEISGLTTSTSAAEFKKDFFDMYLEDEDEIEGLDNGLLTQIYNTLVDSSKTTKGLKKDSNEADKAFKNILKTIDDISKEVRSHIPNGDGSFVSTDKKLLDKDNANYGYKKGNMNNNKQLNLLYKMITMYQNGMTKVTGTYMEIIKFDISQSRRVYGQAASFNPKSVKENAILIEAVGDAEEYEALSLFN